MSRASLLLMTVRRIQLALNTDVFRVSQPRLTVRRFSWESKQTYLAVSSDREEVQLRIKTDVSRVSQSRLTVRRSS